MKNVETTIAICNVKTRVFLVSVKFPKGGVVDYAVLKTGNKKLWMEISEPEKDDIIVATVKKLVYDKMDELIAVEIKETK